MILTHDNYHSQESNQYYMSNSQYKSFCECEARAMALLLGEYVFTPSKAMLVGSYLDAMYSQATTQFAATHPEMFTQKGSLRAEFDHAELMYDRMKCDPLMSQYNNGAQQVIMTRELFETPWKIMIDSYHKDKCIVDRKKCRDFEDMWKNGRKMPWIEYWGYDIQATVYQAVEGNSLPFIISAVTSETVPDIDLLYIPQDIMDSKMSEIAERLPRILNVKRGLEAPTRCETCDYCKQTKIIKEARAYR